MSADERRVAVVTGATSGIGRALARKLAAGGWRIIGLGRDLDRLAAAGAELRSAGDEAQVDMVQADLSLMASVEAAAARIAELTPRLDLLVNNAGGMAREKVITAEGLEANFAANHLGPFLLTERLLPLLRAAAQGRPAGSVRILNTASDASEMLPGIDLDDLQSLQRFSPGLAYCTGKLANVLFARALADRLGPQGVFAHAVHPGAVDSAFFDKAPPETQARTRDLKKATPEEGADTLLWLATTEAGAARNGGYWSNRAPRKPNPVVDDPQVVARFWDESERLVTGALARA